MRKNNTLFSSLIFTDDEDDIQLKLPTITNEINPSILSTNPTTNDTNDTNNNINEANKTPAFLSSCVQSYEVIPIAHIDILTHAYIRLRHSVYLIDMRNLIIGRYASAV